MSATTQAATSPRVRPAEKMAQIARGMPRKRSDVVMHWPRIYRCVPEYDACTPERDRRLM